MSKLPSRRSSYFRLTLLIAVVALLAAFVLWARSVEFATEAPPLYPSDSMSAWKSASSARKQATAQEVLEHLRSERRIGPRTAATFESPRSMRPRIDELVAALDTATDRNQMAYVSPNQSILRTSEMLLGELGWDQ